MDKDRTVYFSKVNMDSSDVYRLATNRELIFEVTNNMIRGFLDGFRFIDKSIFKSEEGELKEQIVNYALTVHESDSETVHGTIYRTAMIFIKERDTIKGGMRTFPVENTEDIEFFYDVLNEYVAFITRRRFGKSMFNDAFGKLLNSISETNNLGYSFYVESYNAGMTVEEMKESIRSDKEIKELIITYRPANPDKRIIDKVAINSQQEKEKLMASRATERTVIYKAKGDITIDGGSDIIQEDLMKLVEMNEGISMIDLTKRGYIAVKSVNKNGDVKSTTDEKPFIKLISNARDFVETAKKGINDILCKEM